MDSLADYIQWMGDFPISMTGFRDADALVLCALSYIDLSPVFPESCEDGEPVRVRDCQRMLDEGKLRVMITGGDKGYPELLAQAAASRRFGELRMSGFRDLFRLEPPLQFSAVCFHDDDDFSFLAYRGTDNSLAGWEEDFMISFTRTEAQELALRYAEEKVAPGRRWYIGGQSKGSNLALYAACLLSEEKWAAVERLYLLDGPGFCPEVLDLGLIDRIDSRTTQVLPCFCVVGKLFAPKISDTRIIRSSYAGFMQHALISWGIDHGALALTDAHDPASLIANEAMDAWITGLSQSDRAVFVGELFAALAAGGAETLDQLHAGGLEGLEAILRRLNESSEITKRALSDLPKYAMQLRLEAIRQKLSAGLDGMLEQAGSTGPMLRAEKPPKDRREE